MSYSRSQPLSATQLANLCSAASSALPSATLVDIFSDYEAEACLLFSDQAATNDAELVPAFYSSYLLVLLLDDDLTEARFLTHRFPPTLADKDPLLADGKSLLRAVWSKNYPLVYQALQDGRWLDHQQPLVHRYLLHFRNSTFKLLSRAYTSIPPQLAAMYLGLDIIEDSIDGRDSSIDAVVAQLTKKGWEWDATKGVLYPRSIPNRQDASLDGITKNSSEQMAKLVGLVGFLGE